MFMTFNICPISNFNDWELKDRKKNEEKCPMGKEQ